MIPVRELRIGNYVHQQKVGVGVVASIESEDENIIGVRFEAGFLFVEQGALDPIPLTEEWLKEFGFEPDSIIGIYMKWKRGTFEIWQAVNEQTFLLDNIKNKKVYLKYVHKLQNCFYELEGEELKRKQP